MTPLRHGEEGLPEIPHLPKDLKELGELAHLLFEWPIRQAPRLALPGCIFIAAILQAAMIFLFSISYSTPSEKQPFSPQIYFLEPDSAVARRLAPWLAANDPAVFSPQYDTRDALPAPPPLRYRPSYEEPPPPLRPLPTEAAAPIQPPLPPLQQEMLRPRRPSAAALQPAPVPQQTAVRWMDELSGRSLLTAPSSVPLPVALSPMAQPALYEVEVGAEGVPLHSVLINTSGDPASDEAGNVWIHAQRFEPAATPSWGRVLILWGTPTSAAPAQNPGTSNPPAAPKP